MRSDVPFHSSVDIQQMQSGKKVERIERAERGGLIISAWRQPMTP